ncbi:uncharacterized protein B0H18DRAFT_1112577 [Fomitopsis serialis]|uniref:uncharacterized protein n=1 Tax=Fomitopsis serialis TaxID=139415 RepID=UPI0020084CBF|nr:uncharacterized protein B0H18DRAFT_1112577 [Neoantrodia serialis]KAH9938421.1 hypothetical protein B0H18DRAFT_1112577 [Neoantrodia serialis]
MAYVSIEADERDLRVSNFNVPTLEQGMRVQREEALQEDLKLNIQLDFCAGYRQDSGGSKFWTFEYFQPYFDVDTKTVLQRCYMTMFPPSATSYQGAYLSPAADLYGPFWTLTTLIFALFVCSSLSSAIASWLSNPAAATHIVYDFSLIFTATSLVYAYGLLLPVLLWFGLRYLGVGEWSVVDAVAIWGMATVVRWAVVGLGALLSGYFLMANVYPILASADTKSVRLIVIFLALLHAGLALSFKIMFFSYYALKDIGPADPTAGGTIP